MIVFKKIFYLILVLSFLSCKKDSKEIIIDDFSESKAIVLKPYKFYPYSMINIWVKGEVNDTVLIKLHSAESEPILKLSGKIDKRWSSDYYGGSKRIIIFDPYKADKGSLKIKAEL